MARVDGAVPVRVGLYGELLEREERQAARFPDWAAEDGSVFRYPRFRLERLRAGLPVEVEIWRLPAWAQPAKPCPRTVIVNPEQ